MLEAEDDEAEAVPLGSQLCAFGKAAYPFSPPMVVTTTTLQKGADAWGHPVRPSAWWLRA